MSDNKALRKVRLFFSVDVVGSTDYKAKYGNIRDDRYWARFFESFFQEFPDTLAAKVVGAKQEFQRHLDDEPLNTLSFWKMAGDEILYTAIVKNEAHVFALTKSFYRAVFDYDKAVYDKWGLRVKGTAWVAGFPIRNSEVMIEDRAEYIGPDIDIGFRICKASRAGRMVASMDLVDLLARHPAVDHFRIYHVGWEQFKGVFDGNPYPIYWIKEADDKPLILPWEPFQCPFTKVFTDANSEENLGDLQKSIKEIRDALPSLGLFSPYFDERDMPQEHKDYWAESEEVEEKDNVLAVNQPLGNEISDSEK